MYRHADPDNAVFEQSPTAFPLSTYRAGETVLKRHDQVGQASSTRKTIDKIEELLGASGGNLVYAGYPYDPFK
jgi:hypothetical protein